VSEPPDVAPEHSDEPLDEPLPPEEPVPEPRKYPSTIGGLFYILIMLTTLAGLGGVVDGHWRVGLEIMGVALVAAALIRAVLNNADAGMLAVRAKWLDVAIVAGLGIAIIALAATIPGQAVR
jgi:hypothetical protein